MEEQFKPEIFCSQEVADALVQHQKIDPGRFTCVTAGDVVEKEGFRTAVLKGMHVDFVSEYQRITGGDVVADSEGDFHEMIEIGARALLGPVTLPEHFEEWMTKYPGGEQLSLDMESKMDQLPSRPCHYYELR